MEMRGLGLDIFGHVGMHDLALDVGIERAGAVFAEFRLVQIRPDPDLGDTSLAQRGLDEVERRGFVRFGLGAGVWTSDIGRAFRMSERIQSGTVWVNTYRVVSYMSPFGGYKDSGLGRENGMDAIREYLQTKSVWINTGAATGNPCVLR